MIKFFRRIRMKLVSENKLSKYLLYAVGEIVLVVIGILIALGINNANQDAEDRKAEADLVVRINEEFQQNKRILKERKNDISASEQSSRALMELMQTNISPSAYHRIDSLIFESIDYQKFIPAQVTVNELIQTGKIGLITDPELKNALLEWSIALENTENKHALFEKWIEETILPFLSQNIALKNVDLFSNIEYSSGSKFENGYDLVFAMREYENILDNHLYHHNLMNAEFNALSAIIEEIIELTHK